MFSRPKQSWPWQVLGLLIRGRAELTTMAVLAVVALWLGTWMHPEVASVVQVGVLAVLFALPWTRRFLVRRMWCVVDRHRLRACLRMAKVRTMNLDGSLPLMLWARPTKTGERIWLWVRAGSSGEDIRDVLEYIAPACYAREARLHVVRQLATVVAVDIVRRDPLSTKKPIVSPLTQWSTDDPGDREGTEPITPVPVHDITTFRATNTAGDARKKKTTSSGPMEPTPLVVVSGEDLTDYVD